MDFRAKCLQRGFMLLMTAVFASSVQAQETHSADAVKAAYLYHFAGYIQWPEDSTSGRPFVIDVVGDPQVSRSILVVSEDEQGLDLGSTLNFETVDKRVRFEVSLTAAEERAGLKISADLLSVAIRVHGGRRQSDDSCIPSALPEDSEAPCNVRQARLVAPVEKLLRDS